MDNSRPRAGTLVALAAAAGAFGAAAMMSTATAPTAHADDFTDVIASVQADYADGASAFSSAASDFGSANGLVPGLGEFFLGVNEDTLAGPENLLIGTVDVLTGHDVLGPLEFDELVPGSFAGALNDVQASLSSGEQFFTQAGTALLAGDFADATYLATQGFDLTAVDPLQDLLLGVVVTLDPGAIVY